MSKAALILATASGLCLWAAQIPEPPSVFTAAQAEAGRKAFQTVGGIPAIKDTCCANCHTSNLTGRVGDADEVPLLSSLDPAIRDGIVANGRIPALAGPKFMNVWAARTTQDLVKRIELADGGDEQTSIDLAAYVLQVNGAKPGSQPLTANTSVEIRSVASGIAPQALPAGQK